MGFWSILGEIAKAIAPHAAPHVARGIVNAARERMGNNNSTETTNPSDEFAEALASINDQLSIIEERAAAAEAAALALQTEMARQWKKVGVWLFVLLIWNLLLTALIVYLLFIHK